MEYQRFGKRYQVRLESGDKLIESLTELAQHEGIGYAALNGLGAVRFITLAYYNVETMQYEKHDLEEQLEVTSLIGNIALKDDVPVLHVHASLGRQDLSLIGGHVFEAIAHATLEVWLRRESAQVRRVFDEESGLSLLSLPERL